MQNAFNWFLQFGPWGFIAVIAVVVVGFAALAVYSSWQRAKALQELAESLGFEFQPKVGLDFIKRIPKFQLLTAGHSHVVRNVLSGSSESTQVMIFDWQFTTGGGKNSTTYLTTIAAIQSVELDLSPFYLRPETVFDWLGMTFDGRDIDFEDRPIFSKKFHLHGNNEKQIRRMFDLEVCEFFERHEGFYAEGHREWLIFYKYGKSVSPQKVQDHFKDAFALYVLLKDRSSEPEVS